MMSSIPALDFQSGPWALSSVAIGEPTPPPPPLPIPHTPYQVPCTPCPIPITTYPYPVPHTDAQYQALERAASS